MERPLLPARPTVNVTLPPMWLRPTGGISEQGGDDVPIVGEVRIFAGAVPALWVPLGGALLNRITYSALFGVIGTTWGAGDGLTTFGIPPAERVPLGAGVQGGLTTRALGDTGGLETVTLSPLESGIPDAQPITITDPTHTHGNGTISDAGHSHGLGASGGITVNDPMHNHGPAAGAFVQSDAGTEYLSAGGDKGTTNGMTAVAPTGITASLTGVTDTAMANISGDTAGSVTGVTAATIGVDAAVAHENMPPFAVFNFAIYAGV